MFNAGQDDAAIAAFGSLGRFLDALRDQFATGRAYHAQTMLRRIVTVTSSLTSPT